VNANNDRSTLVELRFYERFIADPLPASLQAAQAALTECSRALAEGAAGEVAQLRLLSRTARALRQEGQGLDDFMPVVRLLDAEPLSMSDRARSFIDSAIEIMTEPFDDAYSIDMLLRIHEMMVADENAGRFRRDQNYLSRPGRRKPEEAFAVPPEPDRVEDLMRLLPRLATPGSIVGPAAAITWLYEVHPFMDGNGRVARVAFSKWCQHSGIVEVPILLSAASQFAFEHEIRDALIHLRLKKDFTPWAAALGSIILETTAEAHRILASTRTFLERAHAIDVPGVQPQLMSAIAKAICSVESTSAAVLSLAFDLPPRISGTVVERFVAAGLLEVGELGAIESEPMVLANE
jgi:hypothetical protein